MLWSEWLNTKTILPSSVDNYMDGLRYLMESKADIISYDTHIHVALNTNLLEKENDMYVYFIELPKEADFITDMTASSQLHYVIGEIEYNHIHEFINVAVMYQPFFFKLLIKPNEPYETITISYKSYLMNTTDRRYLMDNPITTDTHFYQDGMCSKLSF